MTLKCCYYNRGFCKFGNDCRYSHPSEVCRETSCQRRGCPKRHPKPCKNFFLRKHCRFETKCKFDHFFDCEGCENLNYLLKKEAKKSQDIIKEKDDVIAGMAVEIEKIKGEKNCLEKKVKVSKQENEKLLVQIKKVSDSRMEIENLKREEICLGKKLKVSKSEIEELLDKSRKVSEATIELNDNIATLNAENKGMEKAEKIITKELAESNLMIKKIVEENSELKEKLEKMKNSEVENHADKHLETDDMKVMQFKCTFCDLDCVNESLLRRHTTSKHKKRRQKNFT